MSSSEFLAYVPIFTELSKDTLAKIEQIGSRKMYTKGDVILMEEEAGTDLFVIVSGKVKVTRSSGDGREVILTILSESDFFGEMAILDGLTRSATVTAIRKASCF